MALDASQIPRGGFRLEITPLGRRMLVAYAVVWAVLWITAILRVAWIPMPVGPAGFEVATPTPLRDLLTLTPGDRFGAWQLLSAPFVSATFSSLALGTLGFVFFAAPVERMLGRRGFLQLWFVASIGGALAAWLGSFAFTVGPASFFGMAPAVVATMVVCCMMTPEAVVPFLIVLPVKMRLFAVGIVVLVVISALGINASGQPGLYTFGGLLAGYLWWRSGWDLDPRESLRRRRARRNLRIAVDRAIRPDEDDEPVFH